MTPEEQLVKAFRALGLSEPGAKVATRGRGVAAPSKEAKPANGTSQTVPLREPRKEAIAEAFRSRETAVGWASRGELPWQIGRKS